MAQNFLYEGDHLLLTNGGGSAIESGTPFQKGKIVGVVLGDIAAGETGPVATEGVFLLTKKASLAVSEGDALFWAASPGEITKTAADGFFLGVAAKAAAGSDSEVEVKLVQGGSQAAYVALEATANGSDAATTQALANALKTKLNAVITALQNSGVMLSS